MLLGISTALQGRPSTRNSWPTHNGLSGNSVNFLFHFALSGQFCLIGFFACLFFIFVKFLIVFIGGFVFVLSLKFLYSFCFGRMNIALSG